MSDFPTPGDPAPGDSDSLGAIPPVVSVTYCGHCGRSLNKGSHVVCRTSLDREPATYCTTCRRQLTEVQVTDDGWTARCKKHGEVTGTFPA